MNKPFGVTGLLIRGDLVCAASKRNLPEDLGIPGGKVEPGETTEDAVLRELREEIGIRVLKMEFVYERVDPSDHENCWCYRILEWEGEPHQVEPGIEISWVTVERLLQPSGTYASYNRELFRSIGMLPQGLL